MGWLLYRASIKERTPTAVVALTDNTAARVATYAR
jgi:hypothetical protein